MIILMKNYKNNIKTLNRKKIPSKKVKYTYNIDKITLLNNMKDLDDKRTKTLESCYGIVKQNLGKIFNDLLPGATAHLNLVDKNDVTQGA